MATSGSESDISGAIAASKPSDVEESGVNTARPARLAFWRKAAFGFGNFSRYTVLGIQAYYLNTFLLEVASINAFATGTLMLVKQGYDAVTDPVLGKISDGTRTRWGRRKPYILAGTIPCALLWVLMWWSPPFLADTEWGRLAYYTLILLLFNTFNTVVSVPYNAMTPDVATDYNDRTAIVLLQNVFGLIAVMIFSFLQARAVEFFPIENAGGSTYDYEKGYAVAGLITVSAVALPPVVSILFVKERDLPPRPAKKSSPLDWVKEFFVGIWNALKFKEFMFVTMVFTLSMVAAYIFLNNLVLYVKYVVKNEGETDWVILCAQLAVTLSFFLWAVISARIGKKLTFYLGAIIWSLSSFCIFFIDKGDTPSMIILYCLTAIRGLGAGVGYLIPLALLPDIVELDEMRNGIRWTTLTFLISRREGILYSLLILFQKTGLAVALSGSSYLLGWVGYETTNEKAGNGQADNYQPEAVIWMLRVLMCLVPIACLFLACIFLYFVPSVNRQSSTVSTLESKRKGSTPRVKTASSTNERAPLLLSDPSASEKDESTFSGEEDR